jgi:hypothetical protein
MTNMAQDLNKVIDKLNDLIALDYDAARAYESAIQRMQSVHLIRQLRTFQVDRERHNLTTIQPATFRLQRNHRQSR